MNPKGYWNKERTLDSALKCKNISFFRKKYKGAYKSAIRNNWYDECIVHMKRPIVWNKKWTKENCISVAKLYDNRTELMKKNSSCYVTAIKNGWLEECCKHMVRLGSLNKRLIYSFEFPDNSVYVGLTCNPIKRRDDHFSEIRGKKSSVYQYILKTNLQPNFKELSEYFHRDVASIKEGEFIDEYKNNGWKILNRRKAGALGGGKIKRSKEICINDAKKCNKKDDFNKKHKKSYMTAYRNGWLIDCYEVINNK